jgi:5-oxoprolinase (ATP-hydrolysing)
VPTPGRIQVAAAAGSGAGVAGGAPGRWQFWIDRGGTFTDVVARAPDGRLHVEKRLSSDGAPAEAIRALLARHGAEGAPLAVRLGTTAATNALLERRGVPTLLVANRGFGDALEIGTQERPALFELAIRRPPPLHARALEVAGRSGPDGARSEPLDLEAARGALAQARAAGLRAAAVVWLHACADPEAERALAALAREVGFEYAVGSAEVAREVGYVARGQTAVADAYLTPLLREHVRSLEAALPGARLRFLQSSGALCEGARFRGPRALLSGPAGGAVGAGRVAREAGAALAIALDMGGTSTDVSLLRGGEAEPAPETVVAGVRLRTPALRIHTIAAGGGSLCRFDGVRLTVGPESAGALPGPLCYGLRGPDGAPLARELALTDANAFLGRLPGDRFPLRLDLAPVGTELARLQAGLAAAGHRYGLERLAAGFVEIANERMAQAIARVSVRRGVDPRACALVGFGGAAGQHVCALARRLGIRRVLLHPLAGVLSAWGLGAAALGADLAAEAGGGTLEGGRAPAAALALLDRLEAEGRAALAREGADPRALRAERSLDLRAAGTEAALAVAEPADGDFGAAFAAAHRERFGYERAGRAVEVAAARVRVRGPEGAVAAPSAPGPAATAGASGPRRRARVWFEGPGWCEVPLHWREDLAPGAPLEGPALVLDATGTLVLEPGFAARAAPDGVLELVPAEGAAEREAGRAPRRADDPVRLELAGSRFAAIAERMGAVLEQTAVSVNIRERLDFSCAVFDREGRLVANAPHIPVHLGAMGETVRAVRAAFPALLPGDVAVTNDPFRGGSHLPDVTVVTPVFAARGARPDFFVASRGHHADVGGSTPGSMPADSRTLEEEGVRIEPRLLVRGGRFDEAGLRALLAGGRFPARRPDDNVADLEAMVAANRAGARALELLAVEHGVAAVAEDMAALQRAAGALVRRAVARLPDGEHVFADDLDDGTPLRVCVRVAGERLVVDFEGSGAAHPGNLNAPPAVVRAAVLYVLRCLVRAPIPLNEGCFEPVVLAVPPGSLLDPPAGAAVVGGNVETSQRLVDVLLGALGLAAASQGTMNNVAFGGERFGHYETLGGGAGAGPGFDGASCVQVHMTNTRITDPEVLEARFPVRLVAFARRRGSGGAGRRRGGDGLVRGYRFLEPVTATLLAERRVRAPFGLAGGAPGAPARDVVRRGDGRVERVAGRATLALAAGDELWIETPGGGGYGAPEGADTSQNAR